MVEINLADLLDLRRKPLDFARGPDPAERDRKIIVEEPGLFPENYVIE